MLASLRSTLRSLLRRRRFAALFLTLVALGAGAFGTIFALVNAALLRPLPYRNAERLYALTILEPAPNKAPEEYPASPAEFVRWRDQAHGFDRVEGYWLRNLKLTGDGDPASIPGAAVSAGLFDLLGAQPVRGRAFQASDDAPDNDVALISYGFWIRQFGGDSATIGRRIVVDDVPRTIIGVMPASFSLFFQEGDIWIPLGVGPSWLTNAGGRFLSVVARLHVGTTLTAATEELRNINAQLALDFPRVYSHSVTRVLPIRESLFGPQRTTLILVLGAVVLLLLIAAVNTLNLSFADALARRTSTMTRLALGARPASLLPDRILESAMLGFLAGLIGLGLARLGLSALPRIDPDAFAAMGPLTLDALVVGATLGAALFLAVTVGVITGIRETRTELSGLAGMMNKSGTTRTDRRARDLLLAGQVAVTLTLLAAAGLLGRNFYTLIHRSPGFQAEHVLAVPMTISPVARATSVDRANHVARMLDAVRAIPGVEAASSTQTRFVLSETMQSAFEVQEHPVDPAQLQAANIRHVTPDLVKALGMNVIRGRSINEDDRMDGAMVAMVSESFARSYFPGETAIGKHIHRGTNGPWMEIVGVVNDVMDAGAGFPLGPTFYVPYAQQNTPTARVTLVVRTKSDPGTMSRAIRNAIWSVDHSQVIEALTPLADLMSRSAARPRFQTLATLAFGCMALLLVVVGIYVATLQEMFHRTRELAVRLALGAHPATLLWFAVRSSMRPVIAGIIGGGVLTVPVIAWTHRMLADSASAADAPVVLLVIVVMLAGAALAGAVGGRYVTQLDPRIAMTA